MMNNKAREVTWQTDEKVSTEVVEKRFKHSELRRVIISGQDILQ